MNHLVDLSLAKKSVQIKKHNLLTFLCLNLQNMPKNSANGKKWYFGTNKFGISRCAERPQKMGGQKKKRQALKKLQHMRVETVKKSSKEPTHDLRYLWYMFVFNED